MLMPLWRTCCFFFTNFCNVNDIDGGRMRYGFDSNFVGVSPCLETSKHEEFQSCMGIYLYIYDRFYVNV